MSANSSLSGLIDECLFPNINLIMLSLFVMYVVMAPLFVSVLVLGYQRWKKQHFTAMSHVDVFTFNMVVLDLFCILGTSFYYFGYITYQKEVMKTGYSIILIFGPGQMLFHLATCVERYLAVVYPVVYRRLRGSWGVRIRNITIGCVWLISIGVMVLVKWFYVKFSIIGSLLLSFTSMAFGFCSLSVFCALIRPGPGEGGGARENAEQSKQRAFNSMLIITGALSLRFLSNLIISSIQNSSEPFSYWYCLIGSSSMWFFIPSSLVLPLLFLQREGKLPGCRPKSEESE